ncbi:MAG: fumarylacetoacetate hydrolase family protein [Candidatus Thermoplasmatota archaeon]|jgi:fumarylacetoacetate (FAA) hydrolase|nr:fumarylacetoacetate hydrolase family protein [Candidatus Thermoplasmatota archaeon]MCL5790737.1 fumarylacetoacetate hydrolase family protein [Candidatus Thermoplasmatota archaeon]
MQFGIGSFNGKARKFIFDGIDFFDASVISGDTIDMIRDHISPDSLERIGTPEYFLPPMERTGQIRDFYAFEEHATNSRKTRGLEMLREWYETPVYYYTSNSSLYGSGMQVPYPEFTSKLDLEVEVGMIISRDGRNIREEDGINYIGGLVLMNDWSARDKWIPESRLNLGPSKSKDFATSIGPYITPLGDIMDLYDGRSFDIQVRSTINGEPFSDSNMREIYWPVGKLVSYASLESNLREGDIIMTGTFPGGCKFERQTGDTGWLERGDRVEIFADKLGKLVNVVV